MGYAMKATEKCDVYSFGVLILEVISGRHPVGEERASEELNIFESIFMGAEKDKDGAWDEVFVKDILDSRIEGPQRIFIDKVICLMKTTFECINPSPTQRPTMGKIVQTFQLWHPQ